MFSGQLLNSLIGPACFLPPRQGQGVISCSDSQGFWRGWHTSFNQWLVRYMYVPLGGRQRRVLAIWPIFFFVALWHDLEVRPPGAIY